MAYCTEDQVRNENKKLKNINDVPSVDILDRIAAAETQIKVDLSPVISASDLDSIGSTSLILNRMAVNKAVELSLVQKYGISGKIDERNDVQYFKKEYDKMKDAILNGTLELVSATNTTLTAKSYPKAAGSTVRFYNRKGIPGFVGENEPASDDTYVDD